MCVCLGSGYGFGVGEGNSVRRGYSWAVEGFRFGYSPMRWIV